MNELVELVSVYMCSPLPMQRFLQIGKKKRKKERGEKKKKKEKKRGKHADSHKTPNCPSDVPPCLPPSQSWAGRAGVNRRTPSRPKCSEELVWCL